MLVLNMTSKKKHTIFFISFLTNFIIIIHATHISMNERVERKRREMRTTSILLQFKIIKGSKKLFLRNQQHTFFSQKQGGERWKIISATWDCIHSLLSTKTNEIIHSSRNSNSIWSLLNLGSVVRYPQILICEHYCNVQDGCDY